MVWNILNNVDLETAKNEPLDSRVPFLELSGIIEVKIILMVKNGYCKLPFFIYTFMALVSIKYI